MRKALVSFLAIVNISQAATVITLGGIEGEGYAFVTDTPELNNVSSLKTINLSDGHQFTIENNSNATFEIAKEAYPISGEWKNSDVIYEVNEMMGTKFTGEDFSEGSKLPYIFTTSKAKCSITFDFSERLKGGSLTMYMTATAANTPLSAFNVTGLDNLVIHYATNDGSGFDTTAAFSSSKQMITMFKITGTLTDQSVVILPNGQNQTKTGIQAIAYTIAAPIPETGSPMLLLLGLSSLAARQRRR